jgi:hypothetical protein
MGAKRAVAGRSLPYDMLLAAYQKKNQAKQQSKLPRSTPDFLCTAVPDAISPLQQRPRWMQTPL